MKLFDLSGRVAIVTGASTGLGRGMAQGLAEAGADIVGIARSDQSATAAGVEAAGRRYCAIAADLASADAGDTIREAVAAFGRADILINNAGMIRRADSLDFTESDWDAVIDLNLKSIFFLSQAFARHCVAAGQPGKIIHIASMLSYQGGIRVPAYTAAKSGLLGLARIMANEWAKHHINVNAIAPGYMVTDNTAAIRADATRNAEISARIPAGRWGEPADLAGAAVFLASAASDYVHGTCLPVDGGWLAR
ncbi:2-dehydro-3-deoxy-D-gluconate 5-dehydrogenase KduD [Prosthecodimorpha staleyi]|uniref:2-dehydro-3-deoxy-D-gluconate 5-dehydrogenase KduD n=1 Tax=Prosthecodimorpha staleyi TaxID=2840188 RepID=UPI0021C25D45|nr:2-dehydro-3-deoxy-D-gluconate 5-dehydrogenase KduD [Prosthecodimorpha staleyi]